MCLKFFLMSFQHLLLTDKTFGPIHTLEPFVEIPEWSDDVPNEGGFLSENQLHTACTDPTRKLL